MQAAPPARHPHILGDWPQSKKKDALVSVLSMFDTYSCRLAFPCTGEHFAVGLALTRVKGWGGCRKEMWGCSVSRVIKSRRTLCFVR